VGARELSDLFQVRGDDDKPECYKLGVSGDTATLYDEKDREHTVKS
jgi:hypothetical protein